MNVQFCLQSTDTFDTFLAKRTKLSAISADRSISFFLRPSRKPLYAIRYEYNIVSPNTPETLCKRNKCDKLIYKKQDEFVGSKAKTKVDVNQRTNIKKNQSKKQASHLVHSCDDSTFIT